MTAEGDNGPLLCDPAEKAPLEARNGVEQLDYITSLMERGTDDLRESHVLTLQALAIQDIYPCGGKYRDARKTVVITNSEHQLPEAAFVPTHVRDAVDWINNTRGTKSALERAAYALWRFNWIHPFAGGNGRTSRALAYLIVCMDAKMMLPGVPSMPTLVYDRRDDYIKALQAADKSARQVSAAGEGDIDFSEMSSFLQEMLTRQLAHAIKSLATPKQ